MPNILHRDPESTTPPTPRASPSSPNSQDLHTFMLALGYLTIGSQIVLVRELFTVLYGSDLALAFTLASWTLLTGVGLRWFGPLLRAQPRAAPLGLPVYVLTVTLVFLRVRQWGANDLVVLADYLKIPVLLALPCLLGGALFSWGLGLVPNAATRAAKAYSWETLGGLVVGLVTTVYFVAGGLSVPLLMLFAAVSLSQTGRSPLRGRPYGFLALGIIAPALLPLVTPLRALEHRTLRLHYPKHEVLAHRNSPYGSLTALERGGNAFVCENGVPLPSFTSTPSTEALAAFVTQFPARWEDVLVLRAWSHGYTSQITSFRDCHTAWYEQDRAKYRFALKWQTDAQGQPALPITFAPNPWERNRGNTYDLILHLASTPGALQANSELTREFFLETRKHLRDDGVLAVVLPAAPGFSHPLQETFFTSVLAAMQCHFPTCRRFDTELGAMVLFGSMQPIRTVFSADLLEARYSIPPDAQDIPAEVRAIFANAELGALLSPPDKPAAPVNSLAAPHAYFAYTHFRGRFVEGGGRLWATILRKRPLPWAVALALVFLVGAWLPERSCRGGSRLFWSSWITTMTMLFSLYLFQSIVGQAYWLVALIVAGAMSGIWLGAHPRPVQKCGNVVEHWSPLTIGILPLLFMAPGALTRVPSGLLAVGLLAANVAVSGHLGIRVRLASSYQHSTPKRAESLFLLDLLGASGGMLVGGVVLPWWCGFQNAAYLCVIAAACTLIGSKVRDRRLA
ncbi:MAG: hypothetical protein HN742_42715 [Lentisphaerae bacterium]|jgi:hypothetical protein|nr:hypothetical protein [Lentisphaerota bacterium]MBT5609486.1 hypothetical protein [Lentisphaerota bacterium]MBT7057703.1 hypothetical protein [Lentisphaerota bacterium]MBT7848652.1 hypothetical protein [Lentisphaerota bacterium]